MCNLGSTDVYIDSIHLVTPLNSFLPNSLNNGLLAKGKTQRLWRDSKQAHIRYCSKVVPIHKCLSDETVYNE